MIFDDETQLPVVVLKEKNGSRSLPVWIGPSEASAILLEIEKIKTPRPMTHDLFFQFMKKHRFSIKKLELSHEREAKIAARLFYGRRGFPYSIDVRPSDGIALAVRSKAPIFAAERLVRRNQQNRTTVPIKDTNTAGERFFLRKDSDGLLM